MIPARGSRNVFNRTVSIISRNRYWAPFRGCPVLQSQLLNYLPYRYKTIGNLSHRRDPARDGKAPRIVEPMSATTRRRSPDKLRSRLITARVLPPPIQSGSFEPDRFVSVWNRNRDYRPCLNGKHIKEALSLSKTRLWTAAVLHHALSTQAIARMMEQLPPPPEAGLGIQQPDSAFRLSKEEHPANLQNNPNLLRQVKHSTARQSIS